MKLLKLQKTLWFEIVEKHNLNDKTGTTWSSIYTTTKFVKWNNILWNRAENDQIRVEKNDGIQVHWIKIIMGAIIYRGGSPVIYTGIVIF
jgi:hypothetical protein